MWQFEKTKPGRIPKSAAFDLAAKLALGTATGDQEVELDNLRDLRRRTRNPMSATEIIFQYQRRQREIRLLNELQNYVEFLGRSR